MSGITGANGSEIPYIIKPVIVSNPTRYLVALTFDDGPHSEHTKTILDVLNENDSHGTFFVVGKNIEGNEELIGNALDRGHEFYSHSWDHPLRYDWVMEPTYFYYVDQVVRPHEAIKNIRREPIKMFRAPGGTVPKILTWVFMEFGFAEIHWSIDPKDWERTKNTQDIINATLYGRRGKPRTFFGEIVLFHDIYKKTADAMKTVIPHLRSEGYELVTVSQLARRMGYGIEAGARYKKFIPPRNAPR